MIGAALEYFDMGLSIIPMNPENKAALIKWKKYQTEMPLRNEIEEWWGKWPNAMIGLITGNLNGICLIDADSVDAGKFLKEKCKDIGDPHTQTPRPGWHWYFKTYNGLTCMDGQIHEKIDIKAEGGLAIIPPSHRNGKSYKFLNQDFDLRKLQELPSEIIALVKQLETNSISSTNCKDHATDVVYSCPPLSTNVYFERGGRDNALFHLANYLVKSQMPEDNIRKYLHFFAEHCNPPFTQKETELKLKSALDRTESKEKNISQEIREHVLSTRGYFLSTEIYNCLLLSTRNDKKLCSKVLRGMINDNIIERVGKKNGVFRKIETEAPDMDIFNVKTEEFDFKFPLDLHSHYRPKPKNVIIIAGTQDAGKTAFMLRFAHMNMNQSMKIRYMSSEMGADEMVDRLKDFEGTPLGDWKNVNFKELSSNFQDYILPDGINIIDYLEITDSFYLVAEEIKKIFDKLRKGIAIIGLQKDSKTELGRGGSFSLEKPRLYVTLTANPPEGGIAKIVKCKNWKNKQINPNGRECHFKIRNGNEIRQVTSWEYPSKVSSKQT